MKKNISTRLEKIIEWLIYISVIIVPLIFLPQVNSVFAAPKLYIFRVITLLIILLWGAKCLFSDKIRFKFPKFFWFVIAYAAISIVNTFVTVNIFTSLFGTYGRFLGIFTIINLLFWIYIVFSFINTREKIIKLIWYSVITSFVVGVYGLLQYFDLFVNIIPWTMDPMDRVFSTIGHSNHTAAYLGMNLMLMFALIFNEDNKKRKIMLCIGFALIGLVLILTASRGGVFAVIIAGIVWLVFILKSKKLSKKTFKFTIIGLIIGAIFGILLSGPISKIGVVERTTSTITYVLQGNMPDRVSWWLSSFEMIADKPFLGHGLSTFKDIYNQYRRTDYRLPDDSQDNITPETAHNEYLNIAATQGIIGFLLYAAMIFVLLRSAYKYIKKANQQDKIIALSLLTALLVYLIEVFMSFGTVCTLFIFYTIIGLLVAYINIENNSELVLKRFILFIKAIFIIVVIFIFVLGNYGAFRVIEAEYYFEQANHYQLTGDFENAINSYDKTVEIQGHVPKYYEEYANFIFEFAINLPEQAQVNYLKNAVNLYANAIKINNNYPNILMNQALVYSRLVDLYRNDSDNYEKYKFLSIEVMKVVMEKMKNNPYYVYKFAITLKFYKQYEDALGQFILVKEIRNHYLDTDEKIKELQYLISSGEQTTE